MIMTIMSPSLELLMQSQSFSGQRQINPWAPQSTAKHDNMIK